MKKIFALILSAAMAAGILSGCGSTDTGTTTVRLNEVTHSVFYAPLYAALELGFFQEEGLEVELTNGGICYVATKQGYLLKGYEMKQGFYDYHAGQKIEDSLIDLAKQVR